MNKFRFFAGMITLTLLPVLACGSGDSESTSAADGTSPGIFDGIEVPAEFGGPDSISYDTIVRDKDFLTLEVGQPNPDTLEVGQVFGAPTTATIFYDHWILDLKIITAGSISLRGRDSDEFSETGIASESGNVRVNYNTSYEITQNAPIWTFRPGMNRTCWRVGVGVLTVGVVVHETDGNGEQTGESESAAIDVTVNCVAEDEPVYMGSGGNTEAFLGFSPDEIEWDTDSELGYKFRRSLIDPAEINIGDSFFFYAEFDQQPALRADNSPIRLIFRDANLQADDYDGFVATINIAIDVDGPVSFAFDREQKFESDLAWTSLPEVSLVTWAMSSVRVTCLDEGSGSIQADLDGKRNSGEVIAHSLTGAFECVRGQQPLLEAKRNATGSVYNLGEGDQEIPYDEKQFRVEQPHDGCAAEHVHADFTVYAFEEWARGGLSGWKFNAELPVDDPDPNGCGFGKLELLEAKPVSANGQLFLNLCAKLEKVGTSSNMKRRCAQVRDFVTQ